MLNQLIMRCSQKYQMQAQIDAISKTKYLECKEYQEWRLKKESEKVQKNIGLKY